MPSAPLRFDRFQLLPTERRLLAGGVPVDVGARALDLLCVLVEQAGRLVTKDELLSRVWPDVIVEEANLHVQVSALRKVLGREAIATVPGRGYQFVARLAGDEPAAAVTGAGAAAADALPHLVGREHELTVLHAALDAYALVTLTGTGGVGKTALARHLAVQRRTRQRHGVVWVDLIEIASGSELQGRLAQALELKPRDATPQALAKAAASLDLLLVLDNGEHLGNALGPLCDALLAAAPQLRILVTSQTPLQLFGEHVLRLAGLALPPPGAVPQDALRYGAVALFAACAQRADRRFVLDAGTLPDVLAIGHALDGSALGLQVAAALVGRMPLAAVRQSLDQRLAWPGLPEQPDALSRNRSRSLRSALAWSVGLLDPLPRELFRRMAALSGPAGASLLQEALADDTLDAWTLMDALAVLVDRSLVDASGDELPRYQLLETPRALAAEMLAQQGDDSQWRQRVYRAVALQAATMDTARWERFRSAPGGQEALAPAPDMLAALAWAREHDPAGFVSLMAVMRLSASASGRIAEAAALQEVVEHAPGLPPEVKARALFYGCMLLIHARPAEAQALAERAAAAFASAGDSLGEYAALCLFAEVVSTPPDLARAALRRAEALERPSWGPGVLTRRPRAEGSVANLLDDRPTAIAAFRRAVALQQAAGDKSPAALISLAEAELADGQMEAASRHLLAVIDQLRDGRNETFLYGFGLQNLLAAALVREDFALARRTAAEGWPKARGVGAEGWWADHLALLAALEGRHHTAAGLLGVADAAYAAADDKRQPLEVRHAERAASLVQAAIGEAACAAVRAATAKGPARAEAVRQAALASDDLSA